MVVCAFTRERLELLGEAIASLRAQSFAAQEIILVIDHEPELMAEARQLWPDLKIVPNREKQGLSGARNSGVSVAGGEVVAFLDDDAVAGLEWLERLAGAYADANVLGVGGAVRPRWVEGKPGWFPPEFDWVIGCTHSGMPHELSPVRNLVGANMSFRRKTLLEVGGFSHELGRVGTLPVGCEETDLSIRIGQRWPEAEILYDPAAKVDHFVPPPRGSVRYFLDRCLAEGRSKAMLTGMVGSQDGLSSERSYVRRTLPWGFLADLRDALGGDASGLGRATMLAVGLMTTTAGYLRARVGAKAPAEGAGADSSEEGMRVLMVTPRSPLAQGGVERHVMEVSRRMVAAGVRVEVLCADPKVRGTVTETREGVPIHSVRALPADRDYYLAPRIWKEMRRGDWDIVHVQSYHTLVPPLAMLRALWLGIPYVVTFHGGGHSSQFRNRMRSTQMRLLRPLLARAERLVAVARFEIDQYGRELRLPAEKFVLIPNGTDLSFSAGPVADTDPSSPVLASIGRLERYKGHHRVIAAFPHLLKHEPDAQLLVVGTGPNEEELREQAAELEIAERVEFTSTPSDQPAAMAELLSGISLVVLLSEFETHPLVGLEAAAAGRRLLVADTGGLTELADDGFARAIPLDTSPQDIARAMLEELMKQPPSDRPDLSSWDECASRLLDLYRTVA